MGISIFISYCHEDELYRTALESHLSLMKRNCEIDTWSDRKIVPGSDWGQDISCNLENANIILLLVSSDFIGSDYCFDVEVKRAVERHESGDAVVVPILIRACDWHSAPFANLQALPDGTKPIKKWEDYDEAWLNVVQGLRAITKEFASKVNTPIKQLKLSDIRITPEFESWLDDTEIQLSHRRVDSIKLSDIYVPPHLKELNTDIDELTKLIDVNKKLANSESLLIFADEQLGKTSLVKYCYGSLLEQGYSPLVLNGEDIRTSDFSKLVAKATQEQYRNSSFEESGNDKVLIVDDFSKIVLNQKRNRSLQAVLPGPIFYR